MRANQLDRKTLDGLSEAEIGDAQEEHFNQLQVLFKPVEEAADLRIKQLLGNDYDYYQTYTDQLKERAVIMNGYRTGLENAGVPPLTLDEDEQLVNLVYQARIGANNNPTLEARQLPQIMQQAAAFLTADQVKVFAKFTPSLFSPTVSGVGGMGGVLPAAAPGN